MVFLKSIFIYFSLCLLLINNFQKVKNLKQNTLQGINLRDLFIFLLLTSNIYFCHSICQNDNSSSDTFFLVLSL